MNKTYIALLRAINIGGHTVKMEKLRALFKELGFTNVRTYIQTGNVFFESDETSKEKLCEKIQDHLSKSLGYEVPTMIRTIEDIEHIFELEPFKWVKVDDNTRLIILFLAKSLPMDLELPFKLPKDDVEILSATDGEAFAVMRYEPGKVPNVTGLLEKTLGKTTGRFYHTTEKLLAAAKA
jgi:uncharacterized protein (DUF1697 family)